MITVAPALIPDVSAAVVPVVAQGGSVLSDIGHLAPMMIVAIWVLLHLCADAFAGPGLRTFQRRLALVGVALAAAAGMWQFGDWQYDGGVEVFYGFLVVDHFSILLDLGILAVCGAVVIFAGDYARSHRFEYGEQEALLLIASFGVMILNHSNDMLAIFLGIETMSIAVYVMVGARWNSKRSPEAALKYFVMGAFSTGILLMGIALIYGATGTTGLSEMHDAIARVFNDWNGAQNHVRAAMHPEQFGLSPLEVDAATDKSVTAMAPAALLIPGILLVLGALLFKVSAVPFHMWTPDAYDGAPTPTTAFMAAGVKIGGFAAMLKLMVGSFATYRLVVAPYGWTSVLAVVALLTMTVGNLAAVRQNNIKRLLAYSSIAHVGYILLGVVAAASFYGQAYNATKRSAADHLVWSHSTGDLSVAAILFYVLAYAVATLGAFACVAWFGADNKEGIGTHEWGGLAQRHPGMALGMTICLLSLMGMPPTAGFIGKLFVFRVALEHDSTFLRALVVIALINSVIGAYYYLRIIVAMYFRPPTDKERPVMASRGAQAVVAVCAALSLAIGLGADAGMKRAKLAAAGFVYPQGSEKKAAWVDALRAKWEAQGDEALPGDDDAAAADDAAGDEEEVQAQARGGADAPARGGAVKPPAAAP